MAGKTIAQLETEWGKRERELTSQISHLTETLGYANEAKKSAQGAEASFREDNARLRKELEATRHHEIEAARLRGKLEVYEQRSPGAPDPSLYAYEPSWERDHRQGRPRRPGEL